MLTHREVALRLLYMFISFIAIAVDFVMKDLAFAEPGAKLTALNDGFRYGLQGAAGTNELLGMATGLIEQYAPEQRVLGTRIREGLRRELDAIPTKMLAEFFAKQSVSQDLFNIAKELEAAAYSTTFIAPTTLSAASKGMLGVLLDFWEMDRKSILQNGDSTKPAASGPKNIASAQAPLPGLEAPPKH